MEVEVNILLFGGSVLAYGLTFAIISWENKRGRRKTTQKTIHRRLP